MIIYTKLWRSENVMVNMLLIVTVQSQKINSKIIL